MDSIFIIKLYMFHMLIRKILKEKGMVAPPKDYWLRIDRRSLSLIRAVKCFKLKNKKIKKLYTCHKIWCLKLHYHLLLSQYQLIINSRYYLLTKIWGMFRICLIYHHFQVSCNEKYIFTYLLYIYTNIIIY